VNFVFTFRVRLMKWYRLMILAGAAGLCGCQPAVDHVGQLVVSLATDMALPQQIDTITLQVLVHGQVLVSEPYQVGGGSDLVQIPGTLTLLVGRNAAQPVTVRAFAEKAGSLRTFREVITTVPADRIALLRMPVQWLCGGTAKKESISDGMGSTIVRPISSCDDGNTCMAGRCVPETIDSTTLPDYAPEAVFGGASVPKQGRCFDTVPCMVKGTPVEPDANCTIPKPGADTVNVALRVPGEGICDITTTMCFVPLDGRTAEGWTPTAAGDRLALPVAACEKLHAGMVHAVYVSTACETKTEALPPCGEWSSVPSTRPIEPAQDGSPDLPTPSVIESLLPSDGSASLCCPLMMDANKLYTCVCTASPTPSTSVVAIDPTVQGSLNVVGVLENRQLSGLAVSVFGGALYWLDGNNVQRTQLTGASSPTTALPVDVKPASQASLLLDAAGVYMLANVPELQASPVQLVTLDQKTGASRHFDTGGHTVVFQFDQDAGAIYLGRDVDAPIEGGILRKSAVVRVAKADGHISTLLPDVSVMIADVLHGGYLRMYLDGPRVYAFFEGSPAPDHTVSMEVHRIAVANGASSGSADKLYATSLDPAHAQLNLLGALDGAAVLSRVNYESKFPGATAVASSSLLAVPATGGAPRLLADFSGDAPGEGLVSDATYFYWLNTISGKLYRLARTALR
jgi:hypothetical protein